MPVGGHHRMDWRRPLPCPFGDQLGDVVQHIQDSREYDELEGVKTID